MNKEIIKRRLVRLEAYREQVKLMSSCHIVEHNFYDMNPDHAPMFYGSRGKICHGLDAAGDLSGGFKLIKEGLLKEVEFDIVQLKEQLDEVDTES